MPKEIICNHNGIEEGIHIIHANGCQGDKHQIKIAELPIASHEDAITKKPPTPPVSAGT